MKRDLRVYEGVDRGQKFEIEVDGEKMTAYEGETIASVLHAEGRLAMNYTPKRKDPRGVYCGIGLCYNCIMVIDGVPNTRACQTLATPTAKSKHRRAWKNERSIHGRRRSRHYRSRTRWDFCSHGGR